MMMLPLMTVKDIKKREMKSLVFSVKMEESQTPNEFLFGKLGRFNFPFGVLN